MEDKIYTSEPQLIDNEQKNFPVSAGIIWGLQIISIIFIAYASSSSNNTLEVIFLSILGMIIFFILGIVGIIQSIRLKKKNYKIIAIFLLASSLLMATIITPNYLAGMFGKVFYSVVGKYSEDNLYRDPSNKIESLTNVFLGKVSDDYVTMRNGRVITDSEAIEDVEGKVDTGVVIIKFNEGELRFDPSQDLFFKAKNGVEKPLNIKDIIQKFNFGLNTHPFWDKFYISYPYLLLNLQNYSVSNDREILIYNLNSFQYRTMGLVLSDECKGTSITSIAYENNYLYWSEYKDGAPFGPVVQCTGSYKKEIKLDI